MQRFKNILCVVSTDKNDNAALEHAAMLASNNQASLSVIEVIDEIPPNTPLPGQTISAKDFQTTIVMKHQKRLEKLVAVWGEKVYIKSRVLTGITFLEIIHEVLRNGHDLVIKMAESEGLLKRIFGSEDMHLLRKCSCPVWLVKPTSAKSHQRILAAVDVDDSYPSKELNTRHLLNLQVLEMATSLALSESAELHIVHVWNARGEDAMRNGFIPESEQDIDSYVESIRQQQQRNLNHLLDDLTGRLGQDAVGYLKPIKCLLKGYPRKSVPEYAEKINADLVAMGSVARTGLPGFFMGNTAEVILNQLECSVIAVKPPGFVTPVTLE